VISVLMVRTPTTRQQLSSVPGGLQNGCGPPAPTLRAPALPPSHSWRCVECQHLHLAVAGGATALALHDGCETRAAEATGRPCWCCPTHHCRRHRPRLHHRWLLLLPLRPRCSPRPPDPPVTAPDDEIDPVAPAPGAPTAAAPAAAATSSRYASHRCATMAKTAVAMAGMSRQQPATMLSPPALMATASKAAPSARCCMEEWWGEVEACARYSLQPMQPPAPFSCQRGSPSTTCPRQQAALSTRSACAGARRMMRLTLTAFPGARQLQHRHWPHSRPL